MSKNQPVQHSYEYYEFVNATENVLQKLSPDRSKDETELDKVLGFADWAELCLQLRESERKFRKIFDLSPLPICLISEEGYFIQVNQACVDLWGYSALELTNGMKWQDITEQGDIKLDEEKVSELKKDVEDKVVKKEIFKTYLRKDGTKEFCYLQYTALREPQGELLYFISIIIGERILKKFIQQFEAEKGVNKSGFFN